MINTSYIELSQSALHNNLDFIRSRLPSETTFSHVLKGNAYGHGIKEFGQMVYESGARHFSVFDAFEAYNLHQSLNKPVTIMVMGMIEQDEQLAWLIENEIEFFVFENDRLELSLQLAKKINKPALIHVELETGMNRTGFESSQWPRVMNFCRENQRHLRLKGLCTHFAGAESVANHIRVNRQFQKFKKGAEQFHKHELKAEKLHTACSAAFMRMPRTQLDMVRVGIMQYGFWPSQETYIATAGAKKNPQDPLKRVISWKSRVMSTKNIKKGQYIGYGTSYLASSDMQIATVPVGYAHGFSRTLSNAGRALVRGSRVSVIGIVNMNVMMLDITHLHNVEVGDEVVLIGHQGDQEISVSSFSDFSDQLNYELLTRLPHDIPRYIVN